MGLNDLLAGNENRSSKPTKKVVKVETQKEEQYAFTLRHKKSTKVLLDRVYEVKKEFSDNPSRADIVREALDLLAKKIKLEQLEKKKIELDTLKKDIKI